MGDYYLCEYVSHKALKGPMSSREVAEYIYELDEQIQKMFCNMSRYALAKDGRYPRYPNNKKGNDQLKEDCSKTYYIVSNPKSITMTWEDGKGEVWTIGKDNNEN
jgi:hypothetical protein